MLLTYFLANSKSGLHDTEFSKHKKWIFQANTLLNVENHLRDYHFLDAGGDIWRAKADAIGVQASGPVNCSYDDQIPFRQQEFINAFIEWIVMDNIKIKKAASKRLKRAFKIANMQAADSIPLSGSTINTWISKVFQYFEPTVIDEIRGAKSKIHISFDGWGSKHEKISVVGVVVHFINSKGEVVTRLIGLPELPGHGKAGVGKSLRCTTLFLPSLYIPRWFVNGVVDLQKRYSALLRPLSQ